MRTTVSRTCGACGKAFLVRPAELARGWGRFCSHSCSRQRPTSGRADERGYVRLTHVRGFNRHSLEHRVIVERVLGHALPSGAVVHHVNGVRSDNRNHNLCVIENRVEHQELHRKLRVLRAGGNPWLKARPNQPVIQGGGV